MMTQLIILAVVVLLAFLMYYAYTQYVGEETAETADLDVPAPSTTNSEAPPPATTNSEAPPPARANPVVTVGVNSTDEVEGYEGYQDDLKKSKISVGLNFPVVTAANEDKPSKITLKTTSTTTDIVTWEVTKDVTCPESTICIDEAKRDVTFNLGWSDEGNVNEFNLAVMHSILEIDADLDDQEYASIAPNLDNNQTVELSCTVEYESGYVTSFDSGELQLLNITLGGDVQSAAPITIAAIERSVGKNGITATKAELNICPEKYVLLETSSASGKLEFGGSWVREGEDDVYELNIKGIVDEVLRDVTTAIDLYNYKEAQDKKAVEDNPNILIVCKTEFKKYLNDIKKANSAIQFSEGTNAVLSLINTESFANFKPEPEAMSNVTEYASCR
jgi:hypothetical protein